MYVHRTCTTNNQFQHVQFAHKMSPVSITSWLHSTITCQTIISTGIWSAEVGTSNKSQMVMSDRPWTLLSPPGNCVAVVLDKVEDVQDCIHLVNKTRTKVTLILAEVYNNTKFVSDLALEPLGQDLHLVWYNNGVIKGLKHIISSMLLYTLLESISSVNFLTGHYHNSILINGRAKIRHLKVQFVSMQPYVTSQGLIPEGSDVDVMDSLASRLGFSIEYKYTNNFKNLLKFVTEGSSDMCISHSSIALSRYNLGLDIFASLFRRYLFIQRHPVFISSSYTISQPFTLKVWLAILATISAIAVTLTIINR